MPAFTLAGSPPFSGGKVTIDSVGANKRVTGPVALVSPSQGAIAMRWRFRWAGDGAPANQHRLFSYRDGDPDGIEVFYYGPYGAMVCGSVLSSPSVLQSEAQKPYTAAAETDHTIVAYWTPTVVAISVDGSAFVTNGRAGVPVIAGTTFDIGRYAPSAIQYADGDLYWMVLMSDVPTAADAAAFHAFGNTDPGWSNSPGAKTALWPADDANYYDADPGSPAVLTDASGNANTLTVTGAIPITDGLFAASAGARNFATPNVGSVITAADSASLDLGDVFSLEAWFRLASLPPAGEERVILDKGANAYQLAVIPDGRLIARKSGVGSFVLSANPLGVGVPYHAIVTKSGDDAHVYLNAIEQTGTITRGIVCADNSSALAIGRNVGASGPFHGVIDDVAVYAAVLSRDRATAHYAAATLEGGQPEPPPPPPPSQQQIPGPLGTMLFAFDSTKFAVGPGPVPIPPFDARSDTVGLNRSGSVDGSETYGTWSFVSSPAGNLLRGALPVASTAKRRCDLFNASAGGGDAVGWPIVIGQDMWFAFEFQAPADWATVHTADFFLLAQPSQFPQASSVGPDSWEAYVDRVEWQCQAGRTAQPGEPNYGGNVDFFRVIAIPPERWSYAPDLHQVIHRWKPSIDKTGLTEVWHRKRGEVTWVKTVEKLNIITLQWANQTGAPNPNLKGRDFIDAYTRGGPFPINWYHRKYARATGPGVLEQYLNS